MPRLSGALRGRFKTLNWVGTTAVVVTVPTNKRWHLTYVAHLNDGTGVAGVLSHFAGEGGSVSCPLIQWAATNNLLTIGSPLDIWMEEGDYLSSSDNDAGALNYAEVVEYNVR